jgi:hypothetical protein
VAAGKASGVLGNERLTATTGLVDMSVRGSALSGRVTRQALVVGSVLIGVVAAVVFLPLDASWVQWLSFRHFGG